MSKMTQSDTSTSSIAAVRKDRPRRQAGPRSPGAPRQATLFVCEGGRFDIAARIAVEVVVAVAQHFPRGSNEPI